MLRSVRPVLLPRSYIVLRSTYATSVFTAALPFCIPFFLLAEETSRNTTPTLFPLYFAFSFFLADVFPSRPLSASSVIVRLLHHCPCVSVCRCNVISVFL